MPNNIYNSSFEKWSFGIAKDGNINLPDGWARVNTGITPGADFDYGPNLQAHGSVALSLVVNTGLTITQFTGLFQEVIPTPAVVGQSIVLSGFIFPEYSPRHNVELAIQFHDAAHALISEVRQNWNWASDFTYNNVLQRKFITAVVPPGTHHVRVEHGVRCTVDDSVGSVFSYSHWDKLQLEAGTVPTTFKPSYRDPLDIYDNGQYLFGDLVMNAHSPVYVSNNSGDLYTEFGNGAEIIVTEADGLYDLPTIKASGDFESDFSHGGNLGNPDFLSSRVVTMNLSVIALDEITLHRVLAQIRRILMDSVNSLSLSKLYWKRDHYGSRGQPWYGPNKKWSFARVRRFSGFTSNYEMAAGHMSSGSIEFVLPDPAWYSWWEGYYTWNIPAANLSYQIGDGAGNFGRGTFRSYPKFRINGPVTNPIITLQPVGVTSEPYAQRAIRLTVAIPAGQYVDINTRDRTVVHSSGADWSQYLSSSNEWFYFPSVWLPSGASNVKMIRLIFGASVNASGYSVTVSDYDAWI